MKTVKYFFRTVFEAVFHVVLHLSRQKSLFLVFAFNLQFLSHAICFKRLV